MPTNNPRLNVVMEPPLMYALSRLARKRGVSRSLLARDLLGEALEASEDEYWNVKALERLKTWDDKKSFTLDQVKARFLGSKKSK